MEKITLAEMEQRMREFNHNNPELSERPCIAAVIVYKARNWDAEYSLESRSYKVWNSNRRYQEGKIASSVFASNLDGSDIGVRLDWYNWAVDYCYFCE